MTKTVVIFDQCGQEPIKFCVVEGDKSHLNGKYVNSTETSDEHAEEVSNLIYDNSGKIITALVDLFPVEAVKQGAIVIVCGFIP